MTAGLDDVIRYWKSYHPAGLLWFDENLEIGSGWIVGITSLQGRIPIFSPRPAKSFRALVARTRALRRCSTNRLLPLRNLAWCLASVASAATS